MLGDCMVAVIFINAPVISCSALLSGPTRHKRTLPGWEKYNVLTWLSGSSIYLLIFHLFSAAVAFSGGGGAPAPPFIVILLFLKIEEEAVVLTEILLCPRSTKSLILNTLCQFLPLQETNVQLEPPPAAPPPPCPLALWNRVPFRLWSAACRMEIFCMVNLPSCPQHIHYTSLKNASESFWKGPFFLTSQPISPCFELRQSWAM